MHDCRTMESRLVDLVFGELEIDETSRLMAEMETCAGCLSEYRSMTGTLLVFDEAVEASTPVESYWPEHQAMRRERLEQIAPRANVLKREPLWKRIFTAKLPVPVPIAAALVLALLASSVLALRPSTKEVTTAVQPPVVRQALPQVIEVPVVQEKVITRIVYVEKKERERNEARRPNPTVQRDNPTLTARRAEEESVQGGLFTHANLTDFQPADEMRIRVIRRSNPDEN
jgi:anti-sigma factor RsiW